MNFTIDPKQLIPRGYTFQKLYARNYKCYHRKLASGHRLWLWMKGRNIEINDWYDQSENLIKFFIQNQDCPLFDEIGWQGNPKNYIKVQMNPEDGFVQLYDDKEYFQVFEKSRNLPKSRKGEAWSVWTEKYGDWHNEIIMHRDSMTELINEVNYLTGRDLWLEYKKS